MGNCIKKEKIGNAVYLTPQEVRQRCVHNESQDDAVWALDDAIEAQECPELLYPLDFFHTIKSVHELHSVLKNGRFTILVICRDVPENKIDEKFWWSVEDTELFGGENEAKAAWKRLAFGDDLSLFEYINEKGNVDVVSVWVEMLPEVARALGGWSDDNSKTMLFFDHCGQRMRWLEKYPCEKKSIKETETEEKQEFKTLVWSTEQRMLAVKEFSDQSCVSEENL